MISSIKVGKQTIIHGDCIKTMQSLDNHSIDIVITSPPYNLGINYGTYNDRLHKNDYIDWCLSWTAEIKRVLSDSGSFFLNIGSSVSENTLPISLVSKLIDNFVLQNQIIWVKSIYIPEVGSEGHTFGHFKPINSCRFLNNTHEFIFHFTLNGDVSLNKQAIGAPYVYKSNIGRWNTKQDVRCAGNVWYIPYPTRNSKEKHPASFPVELPLRCLKLHGVSNIGLVLDPFSGYGTTAVACKLLDIPSIGIEIDEQYYLNTVDRLNG